MSRPLSLQLPGPKLSEVNTIPLSKKEVTTNEGYFAGVQFVEAGSPLSTVTASWAIPNANIPLSLRGTTQPANTQFTISVWIGLDAVSVDSSGAPTFSPGVEAGTTSTVIVTGQEIVSQSAYAWYRSGEFDSTAPWSAIPVSPGDIIAFSVCQAPGGSAEVIAYGSNLSSGKASVQTTLRATPGATAYCLIGNDYPPSSTATADFADVFLFGIGSGAQNRTEYNLNSTNATILNYYSSATTPIATSTIVSPQVLEVATSQS